MERISEPATPTMNGAPALSAEEVQLAHDAWFEHSDDCLFIIGVSPGGEFAFEAVNPAYERRTGFRKEDLEGRSPHEALPAPLADAVTRQYRRCIKKRAPIRYEIALDFPVGMRHWQSVLTPVRNGHGEIYRIIGSSRDRTAEVEARELAKTSQGLLQGVIEAAPDIIYLADLVDARITVIGGPVQCAEVGCDADGGQPSLEAWFHDVSS